MESYIQEHSRLPIRVTVATYNIQHGADCCFCWSALADHMIQCGADLVGVQEIDVHTRRVPNVDILEELSRWAQLPQRFFVPTMNYRGGQYGVGMLSRYPLHDPRVLPLPHGISEPRCCGCAEVRLPPSDVPLIFMNTHLTYHSPTQRRLQLEALSRAIPYGQRFVLTGDFNAEAQELTPLLQGKPHIRTVNGREAPLKTFRNPPKAIDHILYDDRFLSLEACGMIDSPDSDHNLLWSTFSFVE